MSFFFFFFPNFIFFPDFIFFSSSFPLFVLTQAPGMGGWG